MSAEVTYRAVVEWSAYDQEGANIEIIEASSMEEAAAKALGLVNDDTTAITVLAVVGCEALDVEAEQDRQLAERRKRAEDEKRISDREKDRAEYLRLRAMFEAPP